MSFVPYGRQDVLAEDIEAVSRVLVSDWLTQGPVVPQFESAVADYCHASHAVAFNSATSALHVSCLALGLGPGDILWTTPITFVASANCALYCGAQVDFVDIDPDTCNMDVNALSQRLATAEAQGRLPKIVVAVHLRGQSCDMVAIHELGKRYGFRIVEDASHAIGGVYRGKPVGNCGYSDIAVFSFHPVKIITSAEGGMAVTNDPRLAESLELLRSHGITRDPHHMTRPPDGPWYYEQVALGFNYRMTEMQAALGLSQMTRLDAYVARRHAIARRYDELLAHLPIAVPGTPEDVRSALHLYVVRLRLSELAVSRREVFDALRADGIGVNVHYIPVHMHPFYRRLGFSDGQFPQAESYYGEALTLPLFPTLDLSSQDRVIESLRKALFR